MEILKSGKHIFGARLSAAERKALDLEIQKSLAEFNRKHELEIEALVIRQIKHRLDIDDVQLREFFDSFADDLLELNRHYELGEEDQAWLCIEMLKREGIDLEQWHRERYPNEKF